MSPPELPPGGPVLGGGGNEVRGTGGRSKLGLSTGRPGG